MEKKKGFQLVTSFYFNRMEDGFDKIMYIYKNKEGKKFYKIVEKPVIEYHVTKPQYVTSENLSYIEREKVIPRKCYNVDLYRDIVSVLHDSKITNYFKEVLAGGYSIPYKLKKIHLDYRLHGSDINIQDYYLKRFLDKYNYKDNYFGITKSFFDIEVDGSECVGFPEPEEAKVPVNAITLKFKDTFYVFILKYNTDTFKEFEDKKLEFIKKLEEKYEGKNYSFSINEFDDEMELIKQFFNTINILKPDFCVAWNMDFDFPYLYNRIINLGGKPELIMCPKEFKYKQAYYKLDKRNQDPCDKNSIFIVSSYTVYCDLLALYANLRKAAGKDESYSLDYISEKELGSHKDEVIENIKTFHLVDYIKFLMYNIQDVALLDDLEAKNKDLDTLYTISLMTRTRIEKALKKTICLRNFAEMFYNQNGCVISNNRSRLYKKTGEKIQGAFVGDPMKIDYIGENIVDGGRKSKFIMDLVIDEDLSSLYPNTTFSSNISKETCVGKLEFIKDEKDKTSELMDDMISNDAIFFCNKYFNLPSIDEMEQLVKEAI